MNAGLVIACSLALAACSMDLGVLQRPREGSDPPNPATDPGGTGGVAGMTGAGAGAAAAASGGAGAGDAGAGGASGGGGAGAPAAGSGGASGQGGSNLQGGSGGPSKPPRRTCGLVGLPCCTPGNTCDLGACLRGECTAYGGFFAFTRGSCEAVDPCESRNAYTAGCSCPSGFDDTLLYRTIEQCDLREVSTEVRSCTAARTPETMFGGVWVEGPDGNCTRSCRTANPVTGQCGCPDGTQALSLNVDSTTPECPGAEWTLQVCINADGEPLNFGGVYALSQSAAEGCSAANPATGGCTCPEGATTPQSLHVGSWSVFVCNL